MSYPQPPGQPDDGRGQYQYPGGYQPMPGAESGYGYPSGPQPGQGWQAPAPSGPQQPYPGQYPQQQPYPQQPGGTPSNDDRMMALLAHLGGILTSLVLPLVLYLVKKDESPFIRHQAAQAFNFQATMLIGQVVSIILMMIIIGIVTSLIVTAVTIIFSIIAAMAANRGEWYSYPIAIPMLK